MFRTILDSIDTSLGLVYRVGVKRVLFGMVTLLILTWWMLRGSDLRAVTLVKESAKLLNQSFSKNRVAAAADVGAAMALIDAATRYEPDKKRLSRAVGGVDIVDYRAYAQRTLDGLLNR